MAIAMVMVASFAMATSLTDGLVGYWPFDGDAKDYSGNSNHGTTHGVTLTADRNGNSRSAYLFNGEDYISVAGNIQLNAIADFTLSVWINVRYWTEDFFIPIACKGSTRQYGVEIVDEKREWVISTGYKSVFEVQELQKNTAGPDGNACIFSNKTIPTGQWIHIAVTRNGHILCAFFNGELIGSSAVSGDISKNDDDFELGRDPPGSVEYLHGSMDDVFLYNRALSSSEVLALYNGSLRVCKIAFEVNGGNGSMDMVNALSGNETALPSNQFTRDGYVFLGWALAPDGEVVYQDGGEIKVDYDMTLYAVWERNAQDFVVRLHGNGGVTADNAKWLDIGFYFDETKALPLKPVERGSRLLGWSIGDPYFDWTQGDGLAGLVADGGRIAFSADEVLELLYNGGTQQVGELGNVVKIGATKEDNEVVTVHLYAIWETEVRIDFFNVERYSGTIRSLEPRDLLNHVGFKLNGKPPLYRSGDTVGLPPGLHYISVVVDNGFGWYVPRWKLLDSMGQPIGDGTGEGFDFRIGSFDSGAVSDVVPGEIGAGSAKKSLYVRLFTENNESGSVCFECFGELTAEQKTAWPDFPAFDASKVEITLRPSSGTLASSSGDVAGLVMRLDEWEALPVGEYLLDVRYLETTGSMKLPYWEASGPRIITVVDGGSLPVDVSFLPFGRYGAYSFAKLSFDGNGGDVPFEEMWIVFGSPPYGVDHFSENRIPVSKRAVDLRSYEWRCDTVDGQRKIRIDSLQTLSNFVARWLDPPGRRFAFVADWEKPEAWLRENASMAMMVANGDIATASTLPAANGCRTVGECYALGIDPEDPNDDLRITQFKVTDGKPVITLNHTEDGSGSSFATRIRTLGTKSLGASTQWDDVTDIADPDVEGYRFFKVKVELP